MAWSGALELGRAAVAARRWREACEHFAEARARPSERLSGPDLELFATASFLRGHPEASFDALTSAHESYAAAGDAVGAVRTAGWLSIELLEFGGIELSAGWVARGVRVAQGLGYTSTAGGLLSVVPAITAMFVGDAAEAMRRFDEIASTAERSGDHELAALAAYGRGKSLTTTGRPAEGFVGFEQAMAAVTVRDMSPLVTCILYRLALDACYEAFDIRRAEQWTPVFAQWCLDQPELVAYTGQCHAYRAALFLLHGEWAEASAAANLAEERLRAGDFTATYVANYQLGELHRLRGEFRAAEEHYRRAAETGWDPQPGHALLHLAEGDAGHAQTMIRRTVGAADEATRRRLLPAVVEIEVAAGDVVAARRAADDLTSLSRSMPTPMLEAVAGFGRAQVLLAEGDAPAALESVDAGASAWSGLNVPYEVARCAALRGRIRLAVGEPDAATAEFGAARAVFGDLGARPALADLIALEAGHRTGTLTGREVEVLRLVSTGLTNRVIAGRLSLSEKTVARHLSNIYGKLGLSSRAGATAYAYEHGLI